MPSPAELVPLRATGTIRGKAQGLRLLVLCAFLSWLLVAAPFAFAGDPCTWTITGGTGIGSADVGYVYGYWGSNDFCAGIGVSGSGIQYHPTTACTQSHLTASVSFTHSIQGDPLVGAYTVTGSGGSCVDPDADPLGGDEDWAIQVADAVTVGWAVILLWLTGAGAVWLGRMVRS